MDQISFDLPDPDEKSAALRAAGFKNFDEAKYYAGLSSGAESAELTKKLSDAVAEIKDLSNGSVDACNDIDRFETALRKIEVANIAKEQIQSLPPPILRELGVDVIPNKNSSTLAARQLLKEVQKVGFDDLAEAVAAVKKRRRCADPFHLQVAEETLVGLRSKLLAATCLPHSEILKLKTMIKIAEAKASQVRCAIALLEKAAKLPVTIKEELQKLVAQKEVGK